MSDVTRNATASWHGTISEGEGVVGPASGAFGRLPISWQTRSADWEGQTSPEELLAAAFGSSYAMAVAKVLSERGAPPTDLDIWVSCSSTGGSTITEVSARVVGDIPGLSDGDLESVAAVALGQCAVAKALRGNVAIMIEGGLPPRGDG